MPSRSEPAAVPARAWTLTGRTLPLGSRTLVMGIVNVTPDSFSDGGKYLDPTAAVAHGQRLVAEGADILDVGGESTRPGSDPVPIEEEIRRVEPVVRALARSVDVPLSVDTRHARVAAAALGAGAAIVNDVSALRDPKMGPLVADAGAGVVLMHMLGEPKTMQKDPHYEDVVRDVRTYLAERARIAESHGIPRGAIAVDPGIGFGKRSGRGIEDNASLLRHVDAFRSLGYPVLIGASRKSFVGNILRVPLGERLEGSLAAAAVAAWQGAEIVRVHDVQATRRVVDLVDAVRNAP